MVNAEEYIIQLFQQSNIIGLGEGAHGLENFHLFFQKLMDNKKIQALVDVIIVEFANANYQDVLDKFILGEDIAINELSQVWRESTQSPGLLGEIPLYFELLKKIRYINSTLSSKKIRVLSGDPPIDWKKVNTLKHYQSQVGYNRDIYPSELAINYGIKDSKRVLLIYSGFHLTKIFDKTINHDTIASSINVKYPNKIKVIEVISTKSFQLEKQAERWPASSIIDLFNSDIGNLPAEKLFSSIYKDGKNITLFQQREVKELFDAFLYLGPSTEWKIIRPEYHFDTVYLNEVNRRRGILKMSPLS